MVRGLRKQVSEDWSGVSMVKQRRAHGGCLGVRRRRRAQEPAIRSGELASKR